MRQCPTPAQHALVSDAPREPVRVEALEQELRRLPPDAEQVAEARERDAARRLALGHERVARAVVRLGRDRVAVADADEAALLLEEARERRDRRASAARARAAPPARPQPRRARRALPSRPAGRASRRAARGRAAARSPAPTAPTAAARRGRADRRRRCRRSSSASELVEPSGGEDPPVRGLHAFDLAVGEMADVSARTGSCTIAAIAPRSTSSIRSALAWRGGAGSITRPPPTVVSARSTTRSPRAATTGSARRSCAQRSPTGTTRASTAVVPWWTSTRGGISASRSSVDVESVARRKRARRDERVAAPQLAAVDPRQRDGDTLPRLGALDGLVVHLHAAHAHRARTGLGVQLVALAERARPQRSRRDGADAAQREHTVDVQARRRRALRRAPARAPSASAPSAARRAPRRCFALTATTGAPGTSSSASARASSSVSSSTRSDFVNATTPRSIPSRRRIARCSSVCGRAPSAASITSRKRSMPVAPATIARTKRSCPGTSTTESCVPSGSSSGA